MLYEKEKYIYIGFIKKTHGEKGKVIFVPRRYINFEHISRVFIKNDSGALEEYRVKLAKKYKEGFILKLSKIKGKETAFSLVAKDVYIKENDLPRKVKIDFGILPPFPAEVDKIPENAEEIGFITKPRGLQGQVAALVEADKFEKLKEGYELYLVTPDEKIYKTEIRAVKKIRELKESGKIYASLRLLYINDVESAERLRKAKLFV